MTSSQRWSGLRSRLWSVLDRAATVAVLVAAVAFFWNGGLRSAPSGGAPADRQTIPIPEDPVALDGTQMMGSPTARVVLMEFSDFQCPYCGRFAQETLPGLRAKYVDAGLVQFVFRHNPLPVHPNAQAAAEAAICAARQGNFWGMHDQLFRDPAKLEESHVVEYAEQLDLDLEAFAHCRTGEARELMMRDAELAATLGLRGTPAFLIGTVGPTGELEVADVIAGAQQIEEFETVLDKLIEKAS